MKLPTHIEELNATGSLREISMNLQAMVKHIELWLIDKLIPFARNPRTHSDAQIAQIEVGRDDADHERSQNRPAMIQRLSLTNLFCTADQVIAYKPVCITVFELR
jgi:hypothetical protein